MKINFKLIVIIIFLFVSCSSRDKSLDGIKNYVNELKNKTLSTNKQKLNETLKKYNELIKILNTATVNKFKVLRQLGLSYLYNEMFDLAINSFEDALKIKPNDSDIHYYLGLSYALKSKVDKEYNQMAQKEYLKALSLEPNNSKILYSISILYYFHLNKIKEAISFMKKAVKYSSPKEYKPFSVLAKYYYDLKKYTMSKKYYKQSLIKTSNNFEKGKIYYNLSKVYKVLGNIIQSKQTYNKALKLNPNLKK